MDWTLYVNMCLSLFNIVLVQLFISVLSSEMEPLQGERSVF